MALDGPDIPVQPELLDLLARTVSQDLLGCLAPLERPEDEDSTAPTELHPRRLERPGWLEDLVELVHRVFADKLA